MYSENRFFILIAWFLASIRDTHSKIAKISLMLGNILERIKTLNISPKTDWPRHCVFVILKTLWDPGDTKHLTGSSSKSLARNLSGFRLFVFNLTSEFIVNFESNSNWECVLSKTIENTANSTKEVVKKMRWDFWLSLRRLEDVVDISDFCRVSWNWEAHC